MSKINVENGLEKVHKAKGKVIVLFYASWCPFSLRFLPIFEKYSKSRPERCIRIITDDKANLCRKYSVDVVPTVLVFENGKVTKRLDGVAGAGLTERELLDFVSED